MVLHKKQSLLFVGTSNEVGRSVWSGAGEGLELRIDLQQVVMLGTYASNRIANFEVQINWSNAASIKIRLISNVWEHLSSIIIYNVIFHSCWPCYSLYITVKMKTFVVRI